MYAESPIILDATQRDFGTLEIMASWTISAQALESVDASKKSVALASTGFRTANWLRVHTDDRCHFMALASQANGYKDLEVSTCCLQFAK